MQVRCFFRPAGRWQSSYILFQQRQQLLVNPSLPHRRHGHLLHIVPHSLPPQIHQGGHARELLEQAAALEAATPKHAVTPGPTLPAEEQLGDLLLQDHPGDALAAYDRALKAYPQRFNSLLGASRAALAGGDRERARRTWESLMANTKDGPRRREAAAWGKKAFGSKGM